ncbi:flagellar hook assembly protein FlgD [Massilia solisilvae]|uniref:Basal-body rod modification protein FlgD n=1 Tax=Massilia solisilvae TaxID=1811225 RepID=A0ABT2BES9_9BURK|nr:flagellar hook assembly protein FlgD [Massilia solisilvae]MCS0607024.1 flagellar hook assembly protein FlgD [Massilia solisilvae]
MSVTTTAATSTSMNELMATMNAKTSTTAAAGSVEAETNKFMTMLVTQLKNQDPLNPMDNAQLTSQLAQLNTVSGINKLNATLETLAGSYQTTQALAATNLIGKGVLVDGSHAALASGQSVFGVELGSAADNVKVIITDPKTGKDVQTIDLGPNQAGVLPIAWNGVPDPSNVDADGKPVVLADGNYTIRVVATRGTDTLTDAKTLSLDTVASVTTNAKDGVKLNLPSKGMVTLADIKQVL